ncbi:MAG: tetratricopeptide repeat protein [Candidatus Bathyarchaeota archaeon]|nr:tetratricopeptide repeat protein [Candidatus Bathyarchaeota archaeon]
MSVKVDPIKLHKDANALMENGKYAEARDLFSQVAELYYKNQNYFGSAEMNYKAGECSFRLKEYQKAVEFFTKSADVSLAKGFDRYGVAALENVRDSYKALGNTKEADEISKKIDEVNKKNAEPEGESSFSVFS